ncbi:nephronectin-like [Astyanax mexicanus]|uniref:Nephronectin n=1 Tax=Astyanax mexicanus TaxID=7994 RepID=A0A8B9HI50_ASTMX|nr:nephronectin-like [Astyanax mexicanus]
MVLFDRLTRPEFGTNGICRYGNRVECCWGWTRESWGECRPVCELGCKHGECVGPGQCRCHPGYTGKTCNQDVNECGLKPRPCKHRCMNTVGSYKCYCLNGYMMMADGTCKNARTCAMANCQYGCAVMKGEIMCQCPSPGLRLGPDRRTCVDIDECATGEARCPRFRKCVNTFGSYICKCHKGFELRYVNGKYQCADKNDRCHDKPESKKCKCKLDPYGRGYDCKPVIKVTIEPARPATTAKPTTRVTTATVTTTTNPPTTTITTTTKPPTTTTTTTSPTTTISTTTIPPTTFLTTVATTTMPTTVAMTTMPTTVATTTIPTTVPTTTIPTTVPTRIPTTVPMTTIPTTVPTTTIPTTVPTTTIPTTVPTTTIPTTVPTTTIPTTVSTTTVPTTVVTTIVPTTLAMETTTIPESTTTELPTTTTAATTTTSTTVTTTTTTTTTTTSSTPAAPPPTAPPTTSPLITSTLDNRIQKEITQRPRGDVHIPRNRGENSVFDLDFDIELGNTAEFARDDPGAGSLSCSFDQGVCSWMTDREGDVRWETVNDPEGGRYLTVAEAPSRRSFRGARLTIPLSSPTNPPWKGGDLCLAFRHRLHGHHIGSLQLFVRNGRSHSPAIWNRTGGHGWRQTQITLWGQGLKSVVLKGERRRGRSGEIAVDDFILRRGACGDGSRE